MVALAKEFRLGSSFPRIDHAVWQQEVEADLSRMVTRGYEGIDLQPLYTEATFPTATDPAGLPGFPPFLRGAQPLGNVLCGWDIRQEHAHPDPAVANAQILDDLNGGVTSIDLRLDAASRHGFDPDDPRAAGLVGRDGVSIASVADMNRLADHVRLSIAGFHFDAGAAFLPAAALYVASSEQAGVPLAALRGGFNADPLKALVRDGALPVPLPVALRQMADLAAWTAANAPCMTAVEVSSVPYHNAGATAADDVAFAIATGIDYLRALTDAGLGIETAARQITFSIGLGCRFYLAIAKLRALRKLWADVVAASGGGIAAQRMMLRVATGRRVLTTRYQSLNILRNTVACYAGAVGGADAITTTPFDQPTGLPTDSSRRNARNTQLILAQECHLARVVDPAGGSWYIENYTRQVATHAWTVVRQIEAGGGMAAAVLDGWVANRIKATETAREHDIATRKVAVIGVTEHAKLSDDRSEQPAPDFPRLAREAIQRLSAWRGECGYPATLDAVATATSGHLAAAAIAAARDGATLGQIAAKLIPAGAHPTLMAPLSVHPYDDAFEALRDDAEAFAATHGHRPRVFLAGIGSPAEQSARKTYATGVFEAGGFEVVQSDAADAFASSGAAIAVICSSDRRYPEGVPSLAPMLRQAGAVTIVLAGHPGASEVAYRTAGVDRFIYTGCDVLETLRALMPSDGGRP
jgi:methylmalonyl-CoA mutase